MSQIFLSVLKFCACLCLLTMLGGVAHAQTCSVQYKGSPGSVQVGDGTLSWTTTYCNGYCQYGGYTQWNYAVTFSIGGAYVTGGGAQYIQYGSSGCSGGPGSGGYPLVLHAPTAGTITVTPAAGSPGYQFSPAYLGYINPKFVVVGVIYVPPGPLSFVSYLNSTTLGKSTSLKTSFSDTSSYSVSVSGTAGLSIPGIFGFTDHYTGTFSREFTNETDNSLQNALTSENSFASTL